MTMINPRDPRFLARWHKAVADVDKRPARVKTMARGLGVTVPELEALVAGLPKRNQALNDMATGLYTLTDDVSNPHHDARVTYGEEAMGTAPKGSVVVFRRFEGCDASDPVAFSEVTVYLPGGGSRKLRLSGEFCYWVLLNLEPRPVTTLRDVLRITGNTENHHMIDLLSALIDMGRIGLADISDAARNIDGLSEDQALARDKRHGWPRTED